MKRLPKQSKYPKSVYVADEEYRIVFIKNLKCFGETDPAKLEIRIKKGMSRRETFTTLIHELLHACEFAHDLTISHKLVYGLEKAIFELLVDNFL